MYIYYSLAVWRLGKNYPSKCQHSPMCISSPDAPLSSKSVCSLAWSLFALWCVKKTLKLTSKWNLISSSQLASAPGYRISVNWQKPKTKMSLLTPFPPSLQIPTPSSSEVFPKCTLKSFFSLSLQHHHPSTLTWSIATGIPLQPSSPPEISLKIWSSHFSA